MNQKARKFCPEDDRMIRAVRGELESREKEDLLGHVAWCWHCRPKFRILTQLRAEFESKAQAFEGIELSEDEERELRRMARRRLKDLSTKPSSFLAKPLAWGTALAAGVLLLILGYVLFIQGPSPDQTFRGAPSPELRLLKPEGRLTDAPAVFLWTEVKGRDSFGFELIDEELNLLYGEKLFTNQTRLPASVKQELVKGKVYLWTVSAFDDAGNRLSSASKTFEIE